MLRSRSTQLVLAKGPDLADEKSLGPEKVENISKRPRIYGDQNPVENPPKKGLLRI